MSQTAPSDAVARDGPRAPRRRRVAAPEALVVLVVAWNLWSLRSQRLEVSYPNDSALHLQMTTLAGHWLSRGQLPLSHWYPHLSTGSPFFVQYQSASAVLTGALGLAVGYATAYAWTLYLLLALWPACVYVTGRLLAWGRWHSAVAAAAAPLLMSVTLRGFGHQAYVWLGNGLWSQLWAAWTLPLAVGFAWRFISQRRYLFGAVSMAGATIALHFLMAYLLGLAIVVIVAVRPSDMARRGGRALLVGAGAVLATLWVTVPLLLEAKWTATDEFQVNTTIATSFGAPRVLGWLFAGSLFDDGRLPVVTVLAALGLVACAARWRTEERSRLLVSLWVLSLLLFFGTPTMGFVLDALPGHANLLFNRYVAGVQLFGLILAGVGAVEALRWGAVTIRRNVPASRGVLSRDGAWARRAPVLGIVAVLALLAPAFVQVGRYDASNATWVNYQQRADATAGRQLDALVSIAESRGGGRVYAGMPSNWGANFRVGGVQVYNFLEDTPVDAVGLTLRTSALMTGPEAYFDERNPADYAILGIHYVLAPTGRAPAVAATLVATRGRFALWTVAARGLVHVVDTWATIPADATNLGARTAGFMSSVLPDRGLFPTIAFAGARAAAPTLGGPPIARGAAGAVLTERDAVVDGRVVATVRTRRTSVVLLSSSFDPGWTVRVDGRRAATEMVAPALVGVKVSPGTHVVVFQYVGYSSYPALFAVGIATLAAAGVGPWLWRRRRTTGG